jgi:hypothetical protein
LHNRRKNTKNLPRKQKILVGHNKTSQGCKNIYTMWCKQKSRTKFIKKRKKKKKEMMILSLWKKQQKENDDDDNYVELQKQTQRNTMKVIMPKKCETTF